METVVSGLDEAACREIVGPRLWTEAQIRWLAPDQFLEAGPTSHRAIWFYRSPWEIVDGESRGESLAGTLEQWLTRNRSVLNLRRQCGEKLFLVNADNVSITALRAELGGTNSGDMPGSDSSFSATEAENEKERKQVIRHLFEWMAPRHFEVTGALDAASWLPASEPEFTVTAAPREEGLIQFLDVQAAPKQENDLLLLQLHQVQEELEQYYLKNVELNELASKNSESQAELEQGNQALRLQLQQMQRELLTVQHAQSDQAVAQTGRFAKLLPGRVRARLARAEANRALEAKLKVVRESEWFDGQWYLETYPDVRDAKMDPAEHFCDFGWKEGRNPGAGFDTSYYVRVNPDVAASGMNPLLHFLQHGRGEGRLPRDPA